MDALNGWNGMEWMHLGGLLSTQEARVALTYRLVRLLRIFHA